MSRPAPDLFSPEERFTSAAESSRLEEMKALLAEGVDINTRRNVWKRTALHAAAGIGKTQVTKFLIARGAKLDLLDDIRLTPLMTACSYGKIKGSQAAMILIEAGADVSYIRKTDEMTALKFAAHSCWPEVIQSLIDRGAEVDGPEGTAQTALMLAARSNHVPGLEVLVRNGADTERRCLLPWAHGCTALGLAELEKRRKAVRFLQELQKRRRAS